MPSDGRPTEAERAFHLAEFAKLNGEISELIRSTAQTFNWAAVGSGALFAWLLAAALPDDIRDMAALIPSLLTLVLAIMAYAQARRIAQMGEYLLRLEQALGAPGLGWESHFRTQSGVVSIATITAWAVLLAGTIAGAALIR